MDEVVHAARALHSGDGGDDGHDDADDVERDVLARNWDAGGAEEQNTQAAGHADADGAEAGAQDDRREDDEDVNNNHGESSQRKK